MKTSVALWAMAIASLLCAATASATVLYSNFGPGDSFGSDYWGVGGIDNTVPAAAITITHPDDYTLDSITAPISHFAGANQITIKVWSDSGGEPGALLDSAAGSNFSALPGNTDATKFAFSGAATLQSGMTYWIGFETINDNTSELVWHWADPSVNLPRAFRFGAGNWIPIGPAPAGAFRVEGTVVPAPASLLLLVVAGFIGRSRRRRMPICC